MKEAPRTIDDLPFCGYLKPFEGNLGRDSDYDTTHFNESSFAEIDAGGCEFTESAFSSAIFDSCRLRRAQFNDVWMDAVRMMGTSAAESSWLDVELVSSIMAGIELFGANMRRVSFFNCKLDSLNFRTAKIQDVTFHHCLLRDVDFSSAVLKNVTFPGSMLDGVAFSKSKLNRLDLRDANSLGISSGLKDLRGALISSAQLLSLAPAMADELGIVVQDH
ncbi:pentapeptide repeat-containing protein (plasmid) [Streptomyces jietaisiensis]|uniref:pentapeptide repeat-containing protein n=1 Tax=Streptomyces griseoaurantiacus TaxID=68213 RepID=UPI002F918013